jgi:hypothetical protein
LRVDARPQRRRRLDPVRGVPREGDRALLLAKPLCELRRGSDSRFEHSTTPRRQRPVGKRRQLGDLNLGSVSSTTSPQHGNTNGNRGPAAAAPSFWMNSVEKITP